MKRRLFVLLALSALTGCGAHHGATLVTLADAAPAPAPSVRSTGHSAFSGGSRRIAAKAAPSASGTAPVASGTPAPASPTAPVDAASAAASPSDLPPLPPDTGTPPDYPWPSDRVNCEAILAQQEAQDIDPSLTPSAALVIQDLLSMGVQRIDIWYGSHLIIKGDAGAFYERWTAKPQDVMPRVSSHVSKVQQYQIEVGFRDNGILMGETPDGDTWVQLERHAYHSTATNPVTKLIGLIENIDSPHGQDYFIYRRTHDNVGPIGLSPYTDTNPLTIKAPGTP